MQKSEDLAHLVRWAHDHGYGDRSLSLTVMWSHEELEEQLGCRVSDDFLDSAQQWLDTTGGGLAGPTAYHVWEDVIRELRREFKDRIAQAEPLCSDQWAPVAAAATLNYSVPNPQLWEHSVQVTEDE